MTVNRAVAFATIRVFRLRAFQIVKGVWPVGDQSVNNDSIVLESHKVVLLMMLWSAACNVKHCARGAYIQ